MKLMRHALSVIFVVLAILALLAMTIQGFQALQLSLVAAWLISAAALNSIGGKLIRIIGYIASAAILVLFAVIMQISVTLEPGSHDAFAGFVVSSAGILLGVLAAVGIYSVAREEKKSAAAS